MSDGMGSTAEEVPAADEPELANVEASRPENSLGEDPHAVGAH